MPVWYAFDRSVRLHSRWLWLLLLACACIGQAAAQGRLQFERLGSGSATDDPTMLASPSAAALADNLIRDDSEGTWWSARVLHADADLGDGLPNVVAFKGGYSASLTLWHPASGWRVARNRYNSPGPPWSAKPEQVVTLPAALMRGDTFFVHVRDPSQRRIRPELVALAPYLAATTARRDVAIATATALLTLALLAMVLVGSLGDPAYRLLAVMALMAAGYVLSWNGELFDLIGHPGVNHFGIALQRSFAMLSIAFSHFFIIAFLRLETRRRLAARVLRTLAWLQIAICGVSWLGSPNPHYLGATASNLLILRSVPVVLHEAWVALRAGIRAGRYVLWAWSPALIVLSLWVFALQDWLPRAAIDLGSLVSVGLAIQVAVLLFGVSDASDRLRRERDHATDEAEHDPLTGVLNRRALERRLPALFAETHSSETPLNLAFLDLDHFKRVNDLHGHAIGDHCLRELVARLAPRQRTGDVFARVGGEEFVLVLRNLDGAAAVAHAQSLCQLVAKEPFAIDAHRIAFTSSIGVATRRPGESPTDVMRRADQALYRAKANGRNQVVLDV